VLTPRRRGDTLTLGPNTLLGLLERQEDIRNNNPGLVVAPPSLVEHALARALVRERRVIGSDTESSSSPSGFGSSPHAMDTGSPTPRSPPIFSSPPQSPSFHSARPSPGLPLPHRASPAQSPSAGLLMALGSSPQSSPAHASSACSLTLQGSPVRSLSACGASSSSLGLAAGVDEFEGLDDTSAGGMGHFYSLTTYSLTTSSEVQNSPNYDHLLPEAVEFQAELPWAAAGFVRRRRRQGLFAGGSRAPGANAAAAASWRRATGWSSGLPGSDEEEEDDGN
jgi:hypothetical protein